MDTHGLALIAAGVILFGLVSRKLEGTIITAPMVFAAFGLLIGEAVFGLADLDFGHGFIHGLAEVTLILVLFSDAARIDGSMFWTAKQLCLTFGPIGRSHPGEVPFNKGNPRHSNDR